MSKKDHIFLALLAGLLALQICAVVQGGVDFDGVDDQINSTTAPNITTTATFAYWQNQSSAQTYGCLFVNHSGTTGVYVHYADSPADELQFFIGATNAISSGFGLVDDVWTHVVMTYNAGTMRFYKNGTFVSEDTTLAVTIGAGTDMRLGTNQFGSEDYQGKMDDFRIYDRVLTDVEILTLYQRTRNRARKRVGGSLDDSGLLMHYEFHDAGAIGTAVSTNGVRDVSGNGHNGTGVNNTAVGEPAHN